MGQLFRTNRRTSILVLVLAAILCAASDAQVKNSSIGATNNNSSPAGQPVEIARGLIVYKDRCAICHFSSSDVKKVGAGLKSIYKRGKFTDGRKVDDTSMENWILNGSKDMPPFKQVLNPGQVRDLITYLKTLQ